ncbi:MAG: hypothetical protein ACOCWB_06335 [Bacteroidota bacterium]
MENKHFYYEVGNRILYKEFNTNKIIIKSNKKFYNFWGITYIVLGIIITWLFVSNQNLKSFAVIAMLFTPGFILTAIGFAYIYNSKQKMKICSVDLDKNLINFNSISKIPFNEIKAIITKIQIGVSTEFSDNNSYVLYILTKKNSAIKILHDDEYPKINEIGIYLSQYLNVNYYEEK